MAKELDGDAVRCARKDAGFRRQLDAAKALRVNRATIIRMERGEERAVGRSTIRRFAELCNVDVESLYAERCAKESLSAETPEEDFLLKAYRKMIGGQRVQLLAIARCLLGPVPETYIARMAMEAAAAGTDSLDELLELTDPDISGAIRKGRDQEKSRKRSSKGRA